MQVVEVFSREYQYVDVYWNNSSMLNDVMPRRNSSSQREEEVIQELKRRWLHPDRKPYGLMDGKQYWFVRCPKCSKGGARMGTGSQGNRVLQVPLLQHGHADGSTCEALRT